MAHKTPASEWMRKPGYLQWSYLVHEDITKWTAKDIKDFINEVDEMIRNLSPVFTVLSDLDKCFSVSLMIKDNPDLYHHIQVFSTAFMEYKKAKDSILMAGESE